MKLVIHDLKAEEWEKTGTAYAGWHVISDDGTIRPCIGCFACWNKTPGKCVIRDGYENMGYLIHHADEVTVISRYTYGGFSGFVKNVFDRCLGYVLPQFEVIRGETHHKKRYDEDKPFTFVFYGHDLCDAEKESAHKYVSAVCANIRGHVKELRFEEYPEQTAAAGKAQDADHCANISPDKVILLNGSMRCINGNSAVFARQLAGNLKNGPELLNLKDYMDDLPSLISRLEEAGTIVLCIPLYVDGLPSQVIRLMEKYSSARSVHSVSSKIYVLANMGLYESSQLQNLFAAVRQWCSKMGFSYCGGLGISAGELLGTLIPYAPFKAWAARRAVRGMEKLAAAINCGEKTEDIYAEPYLFPRSLYIMIANTNWNRTARKNGIRPADLYRQL